MQEFIIIAISYWQVIIIFFGIAIVYSSTGFGGGSSYLAVLALTNLAYTEVRATSLLCNIIVVSGGVYIFYKKGLINWKKILPLVWISMPFAFIGGWLKINQKIFFILLGINLLIAVSLMFISNKKNYSNEIEKKLNLKQNLIFGSGIGFLSGMVGIGGGIFLAPLLHLTYWDTAKKIAATASVFILLNSITGFIGQSLNPKFSLNYTLTFILLFIVFIGGQIGTRLSINFFSQTLIKGITAIIIALAGIRMLGDNLL